jgi:pimeloyl-ACP methyl ester carboxylesterase
LHAVVPAAGLDDVVLWAPSTAGPVALLYAATRPERTRALILVNSFATLARSEGYDTGITPEDHERFVAWFERDWGTGRVLRAFMPDASVDDAPLRDLVRFERQSMPPAVIGAILRWQYAIDVRGPARHQCPDPGLHTVENRWVPIAHGRYLARHIPNARLVDLPAPIKPCCSVRRGKPPWARSKSS